MLTRAPKNKDPAVGPPSSENQKALFEWIGDLYAAHYYDASSLKYRREFILGPLLSDAGMNLSNSRVAELACGGGHTSAILQEWFPGVQCTGFDILPAACADYRRVTGCTAYEMDLTKPVEPGACGAAFDVVMTIGGLHHCVLDLSQAIKNIATLVRPGGLFLMMEPNSHYVFEAVKRLCYRLDKSFEPATEGAIDHSALVSLAAPWFRVRKVRYLGGPAFFLIQNSMITRVPLSMKPAMSRILFPIERLYCRLPGRRFHAFFVAVWERLGSESPG